MFSRGGGKILHSRRRKESKTCVSIKTGWRAQGNMKNERWSRAFEKKGLAMARGVDRGPESLQNHWNQVKFALIAGK